MAPSRDRESAGIKMVAQNKDVRYNYFVDDTLECGIELHGCEVRSIREHRVSFKGAWVSIDDGELILHGFHITPWETTSNKVVKDIGRTEYRLLAHKLEILKLFNQIKLKGKTLMPLNIYIKNGRVKLEVGVCTGKNKADKRQSDKVRTLEREAARYK